MSTDGDPCTEIKDAEQLPEPIRSEGLSVCSDDAIPSEGWLQFSGGADDSSVVKILI